MVLGIVVLAIILDRITQGLGEKTKRMRCLIDEKAETGLSIHACGHIADGLRSGNEDEGGENAEKMEENKEGVTINFGVTPWTSTVPPTKVAKLLIEDMGYTVEETNADAGGVYTGLARGDLDVFMDAWLPDMHANYMEKYGDKLDDTAVSYTEGQLGWVIPTYVEGIESVEDIKGKEDHLRRQNLWN